MIGITLGLFRIVLKSQETRKEYLLVCDHILWFGDSLQDDLLNINQIRAYGMYANETLSMIWIVLILKNITSLIYLMQF